MIHDQIRIRTLVQRVEKHGVIDPASLLKGLAEWMNATGAVKRWRTGKYKELREMMDACLLAYGLSKALETDVWVVRGEREDYDCVLLAVGDDGLQFVGIQLKELPPEHPSRLVTLEGLLGDLAAKPPTDTTLVIRLSSWDVIARVNRAGVITTIAEDPARTQFQFFSHFVSINDSGETAFTAFLSNNDIAIFRADSTSMTTIASTTGRFRAFGFDTALNNAGEVAFTAQLDNGEQGLFSGSGGRVTMHYTSARPVLVDGVKTTLAGGNFGRPSINNTDGEIAFWDRVDGPVPGEGIFAGRSGVFRTRGPTDRFYNGAGDRGDANNNDLGLGAFETSFFNDNGAFVTAIATSQAGVLSIVADTLNGYGGFGFYAPAINNRGQVAFRGFLPDFSTDGVFTGPDPKKNAIITSQEKLDGARLLSGSFSVCSQALNHAGEVVFIVDLVDPTRIEGFRSAIYRASPKKPLAP